MPCYLGLGEASGLQLILSNRYHVESRIWFDGPSVSGTLCCATRLGRSSRYLWLGELLPRHDNSLDRCYSQCNKQRWGGKNQRRKRKGWTHLQVISKGVRIAVTYHIYLSQPFILACTRWTDPPLSHRFCLCFCSPPHKRAGAILLDKQRKCRQMKHRSDRDFGVTVEGEKSGWGVATRRVEQDFMARAYEDAEQKSSGKTWCWWL